MKAPEPTPAQLKEEQARLASSGLAELGFCTKDLARAAALTWRINALKKLRDAVIPGHVYQRPEILLGVADFVGDSYQLAKLCAESKAKTIVFCGVRFMAETAAILSPDKEVLLPAPAAGCSLAESITAAVVILAISGRLRTTTCSSSSRLISSSPSTSRRIASTSFISVP